MTPSAVTIPVSTSQQFSAAVTNTTNTSVTWQVNGTTGGSSTYGTISTSGLYTAPTTVPSSAVTVTAISQADTSKTATASVNISSANTLVVTPAQITVPAGGQQSFSATLGGEAASASWTVSCNSSTYGCGTISADGIYTAPLSPPPGRLVTVRASSNVANPASVSVAISFGSGALIGQYSFTMTGAEGGQPYSSAGSVTFDGKGGITGGTEDRPGGVAPVTITGGTYVADSQGRVAATIHTDAGDESWQITLVNHSRALVMRTDSVIARGDMDLQDTSQFGHLLNGPFTFHLAGTSATGTVPVSGMVGALALDQQGNVTSGVLDSNDGGTVLTNASVNGALTASNPTAGRGTLTLSSSFGTQTFAYYVVNSTSARLIETDGGHDLAGSLESRVASSTVDGSYFQGNYAFVLSGADQTGAVGQGGTFSIDKNGNVSNGVFDRSTDTASALGFLFSGKLDVSDSSTGRSVVTFNAAGTTLKYVVYPPSPNYSNYQLRFLEIDANNVTSGLALQQTGTVYNGSSPSFSGQFAYLAGENSTAVNRSVSGAAAMASAPTGKLDLNDSGNIRLGTDLQGSQFSVTSMSGRGQLDLRAGSYNGTFTTYIVDSSTVLLLETDGKGVLTGVMQSQY